MRKAMLAIAVVALACWPVSGSLNAATNVRNVSGFATQPAAASPAQTAGPQISAVYFADKDLIVQGYNLQPGAVILINGVPHKSHPSEVPLSVAVKNGARKILRLGSAAVVALNPDGIQSAAFQVDSANAPHMVTLADDGLTVKLKVGDEFQVFLSPDLYTWEIFTLSYDSAILAPPAGGGPAVTAVNGLVALLETNAAGVTTLSIVGRPKCLDENPACAQPLRTFAASIVVTE